MHLKATLSTMKPIYKNNTSHDKIRTQGNDGNNSKRKGVAMEIQCLMVLMNVVYQNTKT